MSNYQANPEKQATLTDFIPIEKIGEGSFSSVYKVRRINDNKLYALKKVRLGNLKEKQKNNALNQIRILASLESSHIIEYKQAFCDKKLNLLCIVMQWANQGDLQKRIEKYKRKDLEIPQRQIWKAILHINEGLLLLHSKNILHRDLKTANIFISNGIYKLGDLNVSKVQCSSNLAYTQTGTPYYASPQVWRDEPYDSKSDIWSLGCILYEMCTFKPPFKGRDLQTLYKNVQKCVYEPISMSYSLELSDFVASCLQKNPKNRPSAHDIAKPTGVLAKKCHYYGIQKLSETQSCKMLQTIKFSQDYDELAEKLPKSRYQDCHSYKNLTSETMEKSRESKNHTENSPDKIINELHKNLIKKQIKKYSSQHQELYLEKLQQNSEVYPKQYKIALKKEQPKHQQNSLSQRYISNKVSSSYSKDAIKPKQYITDRNISIEQRFKHYQKSSPFIAQTPKKLFNKQSQVLRKISNSLDEDSLKSKKAIQIEKISSDRSYLRKYQSVLSDKDSQLIKYLIKLKSNKLQKVKSTPYLYKYNLNVISEACNSPKMKKIVDDSNRQRQIKEFKKRLSKKYQSKRQLQ